MKKIVLALSLLIASTAHAGPCEIALGSAFTPAQEVALCRAFGTFNVTGNTANTNFESVAGAGTTQGTAAALSRTRFIHRLTGANGTVGWILPSVTTADANQVHVFLNTTAGVANLYPATGGTINGAAANAVFAALTGIKPIICVVTGTNTWICS